MSENVSTDRYTLKFGWLVDQLVGRQGGTPTIMLASTSCPTKHRWNQVLSGPQGLAHSPGKYPWGVYTALQAWRDELWNLSEDGRLPGLLREGRPSLS